jgi:hypothetical protein
MPKDYDTQATSGTSAQTVHLATVPVDREPKREFDAFEALTSKLVQVPKSAIDEKRKKSEPRD